MGYARWAKRYNLKEMSKTLIFLQEHKIGSIKEMQERVDAATARYHELGDSIKAAEARMTEIAVLRTHIVNYARTRPVYDAYHIAVGDSSAVILSLWKNLFIQLHNDVLRVVIVS